MVHLVVGPQQADITKKVIDQMQTLVMQNCVTIRELVDEAKKKPLVGRGVRDLKNRDLY